MYIMNTDHMAVGSIVRIPKRITFPYHVASFHDKIQVFFA